MANVIIGVAAADLHAGQTRLFDLYHQETGRRAAAPESEDCQEHRRLVEWLKQKLGDDIDCLWADPEHAVVGVLLGDTRDGDTWKLDELWEAERTVAQALARADLTHAHPVALHAFYPAGVYLYGGSSELILGVEAEELGYERPESPDEEEEEEDDVADEDEDEDEPAFFDDWEEPFRAWLRERRLPRVRLDYAIALEDGEPGRDAVGRSVAVIDADDAPTVVSLASLRRAATAARRALGQLGFKGPLSLIPINSW